MRFARELPVRPQRTPAAVVSALGLVAVFASAVTVIGSDALWLPAMGDHIWSTWSIPRGIPFAAAPSGNWVNTTVLGQLVLSGAYLGGSQGVVMAQVLAVLCTLALLSNDALGRGARPFAVALAVVAVVLGAAPSLFIARAQLLSLVPFALLLVLVRRQHDEPTRAIWWAVPLVAVWGNLHGAVLVGIAVLGGYLLLSRVRVAPVTAVAVGAASLVATCANPGLLDAPRYYLGVFSGAATRDESGMWGRPSLANPFDILLVVAAAILITAVLRRRRPLWEYAASLGLLVATLSASRHGVWLLLFLAVPAAFGSGRPRVAASPLNRPFGGLPAGLAVVLLLGSAAMLAVRAPSFGPADEDASQIAKASQGQVTLAPEPLVESLAAAGAKVWVSNPLDAFPPSDQTAYLAFLKGDSFGARRALEQAEIVVAAPGSEQVQIALLNGYTEVGPVGRFIILRRDR